MTIAFDSKDVTYEHAAHLSQHSIVPTMEPLRPLGLPGPPKKRPMHFAAMDSFGGDRPPPDMDRVSFVTAWRPEEGPEARAQDEEGRSPMSSSRSSIEVR